ncbi:tRNA (uracil-5-)-methyltransferase homolog B-like [Schistocerca gregaria]|uniref:tRNA (uracil-5-)-methyltransferase homolog B-like n=1 Tax=Schistocerca gregaria TaxID=7010 RepID=UPI00211E2868|nr:tRNA (uracil-5-)-methyltransferase homolog B-like [Schistocerca gregaria]
MLRSYFSVYCNDCFRLNAVALKLQHRSFHAPAAPLVVPKIPEHVTAENQYECLAEVVTPLWRIPYEQQLELKFQWTKHVVSLIKSKLKPHSHKHNHLKMCRVNNVLPSPVTQEYRNKDEFNVRCGVDGNPKTVGFFVGKTAKHEYVCVPPTYIINMKQKHKDVATAYQQYIRESKYPACHDFRDGGHWRTLLVRSTAAGETMAVVLFHPQQLHEEELQEEAQNLKEFFTQGPGSHCSLTSLYFQACSNTRCTNDQAPFQLLYGEPYLMEHLCGYKFRISPDSFFQVNVAAAEVLYNALFNVAGLDQRTTVLDICCGTGTISILAAKRVRGTVGIEEIRDAVVDARHNALVNEVFNAEFFFGRAEKRLRKVLEDLCLASSIVAVLNPGRRGVGPKVVDVLNNCPQIKRVVYVSCKADNPNTLSNFVQLQESGKFQLHQIIPVDMFPHTFHTELILLFER